jgi:hypothetical protein
MPPQSDLRKALDSRLTAVREILHWKLLRKRGKALQFCLKPDKNNRHFT